MNKLRELCAQAIERNGGYNRGRHETYPLEWNVSIDYSVKTELAELLPKFLEEHPDLTISDIPKDFEWDGEKQAEWALEDMQRGIHDGDNDGYRSYSPETARRYGLPHDRFPRKYKRRTDECVTYPAKKEGWILEDPYTVLYFDVKFSLVGRSGKHLVVTEFEGRELNMSSDDLAERIRDKEGQYGYSNIWCRNLLAMIDEWDKCFGSKQACEELAYQVKWRFDLELEQAVTEAQEKKYWGERDVQTA